MVSSLATCLAGFWLFDRLRASFAEPAWRDGINGLSRRHEAARRTRNVVFRAFV